MRAKFFWLMILLLTFLVTLPVTWCTMAKADFFYSNLYDWISIDEHIQRFAPQNRFGKLEFEKTTKAERVALFGNVVEAIHNNGEGLEKLYYLKHSSFQQTTLFTEAEVLHLKDVSVLINKMKPVIIVMILIWLILISWILLKKIRLPSVKSLLLMSLLMVFTSVLVLSVGPEKVFNQLHVLAFPEDHQWFFYYEESLMSTMMKAPDLFGYIAGIWVTLSTVLTFLLISVVYSFVNRYNS